MSDITLSEFLEQERERYASQAPELSLPTLEELDSTDRGGCAWLAHVTLHFWALAVAEEAAGHHETAVMDAHIAGDYYLEYSKCAG